MPPRAKASTKAPTRRQPQRRQRKEPTVTQESRPETPRSSSESSLTSLSDEVPLRGGKLDFPDPKDIHVVPSRIFSIYTNTPLFHPQPTFTEDSSLRDHPPSSSTSPTRVIADPLDVCVNNTIPEPARVGSVSERLQDEGRDGEGFNQLVPHGAPGLANTKPVRNERHDDEGCHLMVLDDSSDFASGEHTGNEPPLKRRRSVSQEPPHTQRPSGYLPSSSHPHAHPRVLLKRVSPPPNSSTRIGGTIHTSMPQCDENEYRDEDGPRLDGADLRDYPSAPAFARQNIISIHDPLVSTLTNSVRGYLDASQTRAENVGVRVESPSEQAATRLRAIRRFRPWDNLGYLACPLGVACWDVALNLVGAEVEASSAVVLRGGHFWAPDPYILLQESDAGASVMASNYIRLHHILIPSFQRLSAANTALDITEDSENSGSTCLSGRLWKWILGPDIAQVLHPNARMAQLPRKANEATKILRMRASLGLSNVLLVGEEELAFQYPKVFHSALNWWGNILEPSFTKDARLMAFILFELCNIHFALEFRALDIKLADRDPAAHLQSVVRFFGDSLGIPAARPHPDHALDFSDGPRGFKLLLNMGFVMEDWKGGSVLPADVKAKLHTLPKMPSVQPSVVRELEAALCLAYCRAFVEVFDRAPILPRQFPTQEFFRRRGILVS
ncbi:hypothetical protein PUNSTDRAFT_139561 [Punctularia strigosozonata HHB-11173 SS5]|uniref:Uncharacterized protein n=1 Tax=Punctularia strigosozonata (strain HHB-11173) TaxID=741275 RepID=R7RZ82_PUNST|nr:uncharacterized protein PUNSTDRAFT_139561 [Punctularia strigosozonata HHB-11173 SS5]EIN03430.1 hypothetical protein PUNSTDRAFT_139561 [Punctularia strigosozonata HHB-11173 SS5]